MDRLRNLWDSKYWRAGVVGGITFMAARLLLSALPEILSIDRLPAPTLLSLLLGGLAAYFVLKRYRYY